ncbi:MAG: hypothetical protein JSV39_03135 [Candidatus Aenigmatarchaeota archaeon]|nr:MAG: hypothetical protein JSV39_03135 [Candidatus Aenigmarchaeota archaeon]
MAEEGVIIIKVLFFTVLAIIVVIGFVWALTEAVYGKCWSDATNGFAALFKDLVDGKGEKQIPLGKCVKKAYIAVKGEIRDSTGRERNPLDEIKGEGINIFRCGEEKMEGDSEYNFFAIVQPDKEVNVKRLAEEGGKRVTQIFLDAFCAPYKYVLNKITYDGNVITEGKVLLEGGGFDYCIRIESVPVEPKYKDLTITTGECD